MGVAVSLQAAEANILEGSRGDCTYADCRIPFTGKQTMRVPDFSSTRHS